MAPSEWQAAVRELAEARARHEITDEQWFSGMAAAYEAAYLTGDNPRVQSGFGGDEARWEIARRPIVDAIDRDGTFLDVGCASGYLLECLVRWAPHRIEPYGLDLGPRLVELARDRLPHWRDRFFLGNAMTWRPPMRFDFVRTELVYVPEARRRAYVYRLLGQVVAPGGRLIVCGYDSRGRGVAADSVRRVVRSFGLVPDLEFKVEAPEGNGPTIEVAAVEAAATGRARPTAR